MLTDQMASDWKFEAPHSRLAAQLASTLNVRCKGTEKVGNLKPALHNLPINFHTIFIVNMNAIPHFDSRYETIEDIGKGAYGKVFKARDKVDNKIVAVKGIDTSPEKKLRENGFPVVTIREIKFIRELEHPNIIRLKSVVMDGKSYNVYLIFEYCEYDLAGLLRKSPLRFNQAICYMRQILKGLLVCHTRNVYHRDLKPANILVTKENVVKIGDFGLAKKYQPTDKDKRKTYRVITVWYRPLELLLKDRHYGMEVDIWSVGCIFYEMMTGKVLFHGVSDGNEEAQEMSQVKAIMDICGHPNENGWTSWSKLEAAELVSGYKGNGGMTLQRHLEDTIPEEYKKAGAVDFLLNMLKINPRERFTAKQAFLHPFLHPPDGRYEPDQLEKLTIAETHSGQQKPAARPGGIQIRRQ